MVNIQKHKLIKQCYNVSQAIEECGASDKLTKAVVMCGDLMENIDKFIDEVAELEEKAWKYDELCK